MQKTTQSSLKDSLLAIDVRTLGLARIAIASLLLFDLAKRANGMSVWYFETGLLPNSMLNLHPLRPFARSFLSYVDSDVGVRIAFALIALVYVGFLFGILTRTLHVASYVCLVSLQVRVDPLANGGDFVFCILLLWTAFLPFGAAFSVDAWRKRRAGRALTASPVVSWAVPVVIGQLAIIYFFNASHKNGRTWMDGSAVYWLTHQERIVTWLGLWIREHLPLWTFQTMTYFSLLTEYLLSVLIVVRWGPPWTRRLAILLIWLLHLGIASMANVGLFSFVMLAYSTLLVGTDDWEWIRGRLAATWGGRSAGVRWLTLRPIESAARPRPFLRLSKNTVLLYLVLIALCRVAFENPAISEHLRWKEPVWIKANVQLLRLHQGWGMFAPDAPREDRWIVVEATTESGRRVDPFNEIGARVSDPTLRTIPQRLAQNYYFCDYTDRITAYRAYHRGLSDWLFHYHERTGNPADRIQSFIAYEVTQSSPPPGTEMPHDVKARPFLKRRRAPES